MDASMSASGMERRQVDDVQAFYDSRADYEWDRLNRHRLEFALNMRFLSEHLPVPPAQALDVGGGPGRYALALAQKGYRVTLLDLSKPLLEFALKKGVEARVTLDRTIHGNALDLSPLAADSFDAVLLMGPLYHLLEAPLRLQALREAARVLKPGGTLATAFISRYSTMRVHSPRWLLDHTKDVAAEMETGLRRDVGRGFTDAYLAHPAEVAPLLEGVGLQFLAMIASEGLRFDAEPETNGLTGDDWNAWVDLNYRLAQDPSIHGAAVHLLAVARKA